MDQKQSQNNEASPPWQRFKLLLGIVASAELIVILVTLLAGNAVSGTELAASAVRILLVALSGWFLLVRDTAEAMSQVKSVSSIDSPQVVSEEEVWPNIDKLTHTSNQRGLTIHMLEMMALAERYHHKLSVCMIKVSGLIALSDEEREEVLISASVLLSEMVRIPDKVGRYDETLFMVIMPEADYSGASLVAGRLHTSLNNDIGEKATISMGVAEFEPGDDLQRLLARAQESLDNELKGDKE